jgi:hypothetical protein
VNPQDFGNLSPSIFIGQLYCGISNQYPYGQTHQVCKYFGCNAKLRGKPGDNEIDGNMCAMQCGIYKRKGYGNRHCHFKQLIAPGKDKMHKSAQYIANQKQHTHRKKNTACNGTAFGYTTEQIGKKIHVSPSSFGQ